MTRQDEILQLFSVFPQLTTQLIRDNTKMPMSSVYGSIRALYSKGLIDVDYMDNRISIRLKGRFRKFRYTIRVLETHTNKRTRKQEWNADLEATLIGMCPINYNEKMIRDKFRETLFDKMMEICSNTTPAILPIPLRLIDIEDMASKGISGVELGEIVTHYDPHMDIEVVFTNNIGRIYDKKDGLSDKMQTRLDQF